MNQISQNEDDYISVYELIEWAREVSNGSIREATYLLLEDLDKKTIQTYRKSPLTKRISKTNTNLFDMLREANKFDSHDCDCDIPF
ncbi:hypothetical protein [Histophilus somni]|uniref:hypothetical protein n=1 Tax=Histophilus somni TaxID=731 RepID=UPI00201EDA9C|nr:hypothetical protein [Histophilus somni]